MTSMEDGGPIRSDHISIQNSFIRTASQSTYKVNLVLKQHIHQHHQSLLDIHFSYFSSDRCFGYLFSRNRFYFSFHFQIVGLFHAFKMKFNQDHHILDAILIDKRLLPFILNLKS